MIAAALSFAMGLWRGTFRGSLVAATKLDIAHGEVACDNELRAAPTNCDALASRADVSLRDSVVEEIQRQD